jgi:hypothetical protein
MLADPKGYARFTIAGRRTNEDWAIMRQRLTTNPDTAVWAEAVRDYFEARLGDRYLEPIKWLQDTGAARGEGFSIVAIQCTLIEFLESTVGGKCYVYNGHGKHVYSSSSKLFKDFLTKREPFRNTFTVELARSFYKGVRCGLLHEAQTKLGWKIRAASPAKSIVDAEKLIVYRNDLQRALLDFIDWYKQEIPRSGKLQEGFIRKFDGLVLG